MTEAFCGTCKHFNKTGEEYIGECLLNPPVFTPSQGIEFCHPRAWHQPHVWSDSSICSKHVPQSN